MITRAGDDIKNIKLKSTRNCDAGVKIRRAKTADIGDIFDLAAESNLSTWQLSDYERAVTKSSYLFLTATICDAFAGFLLSRLITGNTVSPSTSIHRIRLLESTDSPLFLEVEILNIAVCGEARRSGVGRELVSSLIKMQPVNMTPMLFLEVRESNCSAQSFYHELGFEQSGKRSGYYSDPCEDAVLMKYRVSAE